MTNQERIETKCREIYRRTKPRLEAVRTRPYFGFKIFNSPPVYRPPILFIGYQPSGGRAVWKEQEKLRTHLTWPDRPEFVARDDWALAKRLRELLGYRLLEQSVGLNAIFLRYPRVSDYKTAITKTDRIAVEAFCLKTVAEIVDLLAPKLILIIGIGTLKLFDSKPKALLRSKKVRHRVLIAKGSLGKRSALGIIHLSGARYSTADRAAVYKHIRKCAACVASA